MKNLLKKKSTWIAIVLMLLYVVIVGVSCMSSPKNVGLVDGKFHPCPDSPNCVSSQSEKKDKKVDPIVYKGEALDAKNRLKTVLEAIPRMKIVKETDNYIHAEATTLIFRFVDDCEFLIDENGKVIHVKSESRLGHSDFGVNRKRVENIRQKFAAVKN